MAESYLGSEVSIVERVRKELIDANERFAEFDEAIEFDLTFCGDMEHYDSDSGSTDRTLYRIKPKDPGIFRVWRYKTALVLKRFPVVVETRPPRKMPPDPSALAASKMAKHAIEDVLSEPIRGYDRVRRQVVGGALMARAWGAKLDFDPKLGLLFDDVDPRRIRWAPGFKDPHHPLNPWVDITVRMTVDRVKSMKAAGWKVPADLTGDRDDLRLGMTIRNDQPLSATTSAPSERDGSSDLVTISFRWYRFEKAYKVNLKAGERTLECVGCGKKSPSEAEAGVPEFPPALLGGCDQCGGDMVRVDSLETDKRLVISAPFSGHTEPFVDDRWPFDYPTFPILWYMAYPLPHRAIGQSDTSILRTVAISSNAMVRLAYETMLKSKPYFFARGEMQNAWGGVFTFQPEDGDIIYGKDDFARLDIMQGSGVNQSLFALLDRLQAAFRTNEGTSEVAMTPQQLKDAKVGALEIASETGNVVTDDHGALLYEAETCLFMCVAQALRELPSKPVRVQMPDGSWSYQRIGGAEMPDVDVKVGAGAKLDMLDADELAGFAQLAQMPPPMRRVYAQLAHIDPEVLSMLDEAEQEMQQMMQPSMPGMGGPPPQAGPPGGGMPPPDMAAMGQGVV